MNFDNLDNSHNSFPWPEYLIDFLCERWIPCQASTSVMCLHYRPVTAHCSTKDVYTSEITFLAILASCHIMFSYSEVRKKRIRPTYLFKIKHRKVLNTKIQMGFKALLEPLVYRVLYADILQRYLFFGWVHPKVE